MIGVVSTLGLWALFDIHQRLHEVKRDEERARSVVRLASAVRDQYAHVAHTIILSNDTHASLFRKATRRLDALTADVRSTDGGAGATEVDRIIAASKEITRLFETEILSASVRGDRAALATWHDRVLALTMDAEAQAETLARRGEHAMDDLNQHVRATQHGAIRLTIVAHLIALVTAVLAGIYLYRTIARPIATLSAAASRVGAGHLDSRIPVEREDELGRLSRRFNEMTASVKEHQKKLLHSERLMGLASVSAGIAHELNNPIGVIVGYAKLLRRRGDAADPKVLEAIEEEAERCQQVIEGLLELTRGGVIDTRSIDLRATVDDVVTRMRMRGAPSGIALEVHGHATARGDALRLRHIFTNLIQNAIEACDKTGRVVLLIDEPSPRVATVEVRDSGGGLSQDTRDSMFEPFFTTKPAGTGLGLAISRAIARAHGGDIDLVSTTERGSTFRVTLPAADPEPAA